MKAKELRRLLRQHGCLEVRQAGSHIRVECAQSRCRTTIPVHAGEDLGKGLLAQIERDLAGCLGSHWLRKGKP